jgi:hypothetical protein
LRDKIYQHRSFPVVGVLFSPLFSALLRRRRRRCPPPPPPRLHNSFLFFFSLLREEGSKFILRWKLRWLLV